MNSIHKIDDTLEIDIGDHPTDKEQQELLGLIREHKDAFSDGSKLGCASYKHTIELTDTKPFRIPLRRMAFKEKEFIQSQVDEMMEKGIIQESKSPFSSPIVLVKKRDNSIRFCIDFRKLNSQTKKWVFPLPNQEEILEAGSGAQYDTTLDLNSGYWQMSMDEQSRQYTAFNTVDNQYEFIRMPFGLSNAAASFSKMMATVMAGLVGQIVHVYLDDLIVMTKTWTQHKEYLKMVLAKIQEANLTIKLAKCRFAHHEANVLGHVLSKECIRPQANKLAAIERLQPPRNIEELRQFLGLCGYYRKFVPAFAAISAPMADLLKKDTPFVWTDQQQSSFESLKQGLLNSKAIAYFKPGGQLMLKTDASRKGFGGILLQLQDDDWRIVATTSRRLSSGEKNFGVTELEGAALVEALTKFRPLIYGRKIRIIVDHCALCALAKTKPVVGRLARWAIYLFQFDLEIIYRSGKQHEDVDCLSRQPVADENDRLDESRFVYALIPLDDYKSHYEKDVDCKHALDLISKGDTTFNLTNGHIYKATKLLVPKAFRSNIMENAHVQGHAGIDQTLEIIDRKYFWQTMRTDVDQRVRNCSTCQAQKVPRSKPLGLMHSFTPSRPFEMVCLDHLGPLDTTRKGHKHVLIAVDAFSKLVIAAPTISTGAEEIIKFIIDNLIAYHGVPFSILTDGGSGFTAKLTREVADTFGFDLIHSTP